jgi:pimeloyl-ACP methyl ester carboxylesterase
MTRWITVSVSRFSQSLTIEYSMPEHILMVHGAWQGSWVWKKIVPLLSERGYKVHTLDLPGNSSESRITKEATLDNYADTILAKASQIGSTDLVLIGHSLGGAAITAAASKDSSPFKKLIYLCAFAPSSGRSVGEIAQKSFELTGTGPQYAPTSSGQAVELTSQSILDIFLHDCTELTINEVKDLFTPQPVAPLMASLQWTEQLFSLPKDYVVCTLDRALAPALQLEMAKELGCVHIRSLSAGHEPFFSAPEDLANVLDDLIAATI